jgi:hypothetical protein
MLQPILPILYLFVAWGLTALVTPQLRAIKGMPPMLRLPLFGGEFRLTGEQALCLGTFLVIVPWSRCAV